MPVAPVVSSDCRKTANVAFRVDVAPRRMRRTNERSIARASPGQNAVATENPTCLTNRRRVQSCNDMASLTVSLVKTPSRTSAKTTSTSEISRASP